MMPDWLDEMLAEQAARDEQRQREADQLRLHAGAVREYLPLFMRALSQRAEEVVNRYNIENASRADREVLHTPDADGGFGVGTTGLFGPLRGVYCRFDADAARISVEWRLPSDSGVIEPKEAEFSVTVKPDGKVFATDSVERFDSVDALLEHMLVPVLFPDQPKRQPTRKIRFDEDELA